MARRTKRLWTDEELRSICFQTTAPGASVAQVARRYAMNANMVFKWFRDARRPDVTIVRDPSSPPIAANISRFVDFKFGTDSLSRAQLSAYSAIGGGRPPLVLDVNTCDCGNDDETKGQVALATAAQDIRENHRSLLTRIGWGALGTVAALGAIALAIVPLDGPAGETLAGMGSAASFARAFAAAGWTAARRQAAAAVASQRWQAIYAGGF